jgi:hypothetical protein
MAALRWLYRISDRVIYVLFAIGVLSSPFYRVDLIRTHLLGGAPPPAVAGLAVLALGVCVAWRSVLRRDFVWAEPAELTWSDSGDTRVGTLGRRLWAAWAARFAAVAYLVAVAVAVLGQSAWLPAGCALFAAVALLAAVVGRRRRGGREAWLEYAVVVALVVVAGAAAVSTVGPLPLWILTGAAVVVAVAALVGSGAAGRPAVATAANRDDLVHGYLRRTFRRVTVSFGDALALLPEPSPLPWPKLLAGRGVVARLVVAGMLMRVRSVLLAVLCVIGIVVVHQAFPLASPVWLVGLGAYVAGVPFASTLASLWAVPGLRRWVGCRDITLRIATAAGVAVVAFAVVLLISVVVPLTVAAWFAVPLAVGAVVRTVTRPPLDWGNVGAGVTPGGVLLPVGVLLQLAHGPELLVVGLLIIGSGMLLAALVPVAVGFAAYGVAR